MHHPTQFQAMARTREKDRMQEAQAHRAAKQAKRAPVAGSSWMMRLLAALARKATRLSPSGRVRPCQATAPDYKQDLMDNNWSER